MAQTSLSIAGQTNHWYVTNTAPLADNLAYTNVIVVVDSNGNSATNISTFNTWGMEDLYIEAEDYNFGGGGFQAAAFPDVFNSYGDTNHAGINGMDYQESDPSGTNNLYRPGDLPQVELAHDALDHAHYADMGFTDFSLGFIQNGEWANYTRVLDTNAYHVQARMAGFGANPLMLLERLAEPTATGAAQPRAALGVFACPSWTGGVTNFEFVPLTDFFGNPVAVQFPGTNTFRCTCIGSSGSYNFNYLILNPVDNPGVLRPYVSAGYPVPGAKGVPGDATFWFTIANRQTAVSPDSIHLFLNGSDLTAGNLLDSNAAGVTVTNKPPAPLPGGTNALRLVFFDEGVWHTNQWTFMVPMPTNMPPEIQNVQPADGATYLVAASTQISFDAISHYSTVATGNIALVLNGVPQASLTFAALPSGWHVVDTVPLSDDQVYTGVITVQDANDKRATKTFKFNTWGSGNLFVEAEDYNFGGGGFLTDAMPDAINGYAGMLGSNGVDYLKFDLAGTNNLYRSNDLPQVEFSQDVDHAGFAGGGHTDYNLGFIQNGEWANYTRVLGTNVYSVYARMAGFGENPLMLLERLAEPTATTSNQLRAVLGAFACPSTGGVTNYAFVPLSDFFGNPVAVQFPGTNTFRCACAGSSGSYNFNYLIFAPATNSGSALRPYLSAGYPAPNATAVSADTALWFTIANRQTAACSTNIQLTLNGAPVTNAITVVTNAAGVAVTNQPPAWLPGGTNTLTAVFDDGTGSLTNQWQFIVARSPVITAQPVPTNVLAGGAASFTIAATSAEPMVYQWQFNGANLADGSRIGGANTATLSLLNTRTNDAGSYRCVVANIRGTVTSSNAALTVTIPTPSITAQPVSKSVAWGATAGFSAAASGAEPLAYRWRFNNADLADGTHIGGAGTASLFITNVQTGDLGSYRLVVTNAYGACTSAIATLSLTGLPLDVALNTTGLTWITGGNAVWTGQTVFSHDGTAAAQSGALTDSQQSWLQTTVTGPTNVFFYWKVSSETNYDCLSFAIDGVEQRRISGEVGWEQRSFFLAGGSHVLRWTYSKDVSLSRGTDRAWVDEVSFGAGVPPEIACSTNSITTQAGNTASFAVAATGTEPFTYVWRQGGPVGPIVSGQNTNPLRLVNVQAGDAGAYWSQVNNQWGIRLCQAGTLAVTASAPRILSQPLPQVSTIGGAAAFTVAAVGTAPISYQWQCYQTNLPGFTSSNAWLYNLQPADAGPYRVVLSNSVGVVTSTVAWLSVADVAAWGSSNYGETNVLLSATNDVGVAGGESLSMALGANGGLLAWGIGSFGETYVPSGASNLVGLVSAGHHTAVLRADGGVVAWGSNSYGQCVVPASASNVVALAANDDYCLALRADRRVVAWGLSSMTTVPAAATNVVAIAAGGLGGGSPYHHALALRADGRIVPWGNNSFGQTNIPVAATSIVAIAAGTYHSLALRADGKVFAWGDDTYYQTNIPGSATNVMAIAAAENFNLVLKSNGTVVAWGQSAWSVPSDLTNVVAISTSGGYNHCLALKSNGTVVAWGNNAQGQCNVPASVNNAASVIAIAALKSHSLALMCSRAPRLGVQPLSRSVPVDGSVLFQLSCGGLPPFAYQWQSNNTNLSGATNSWLYLTNLQTSAVGYYRVVITNLYGCATSAAATLSVGGLLPPEGQPTAAFVAWPNPAACHQTVSFDAGSSTHSSTNRSIIWYSWTFGDGTSASGAGPTATHFYNQYGTNRVTLTVYDNNTPSQCSTVTNQVVISLGNHPPIAVHHGPYTVNLGEGVFLDPSGSCDPDAGCGDSIRSCAWNVANGAYVLTNMTGGYLNLYQVNSLGAGVFPLALTVTDTLGATNRATTTLTVYNNRPFAAFTRNPVVPGPGQPVAFYAGSSSHGRPDRLIVSYAWNFGDGTQGSGQSATHTYTNPGAYSVTLTVTDNNQPPKTDTVTNALTVLGPPQFDTSPVALQLTAAGLRLTLTNLSGSGNIIVFASTNLQSWTPVLTSPPTAGSLQWTDLAVTNWPARYYRASESR